MNNFNLTPIEHCGQRVLTTAQLAEAYGTDVKVISNNFNRNKSHYIEGKHFYRITGDELKAFKTIHQFDEQLKHTASVYLWTEKGALLHAKSLNTDMAWEAYDYLLEYYFRTRELITSYTELLKLYNDINYNIKVLEQKIDALEKKSGEIAGKSVQDTVDTLVPCFYMSDVKNDSLEQKINKLEKTSDNIEKIVRTSENSTKPTFHKKTKNKIKSQPIENPSLVFEFINECCERRCGYRNNVTTADLYRAFEKWCLIKNTNAPSKPIFIDQICAYFQTDDKRNIRKNIAGKWYYLITLTPSAMKKLKK